MIPRTDRLSYVFVALIFFTGSVLARPQTQQSVLDRNAASISGRVTVDGKPKAGLMVELFTPITNGPRRPIAKATTSKIGKYVLTKIPSGTYDVSPSAPTLVVPNEGTGGQSGKSVTIEAGETVKGINFDLLSSGGISGRVRDVSGDAVKGQTVQLLLIDKENHSRPYSSVRGVTNDEGVYSIPGAPPGRYIVKVGTAYGLSIHGPRQARDTYAETFHPDASDATKATVVEVGSGRETKDIDITVSGPLKVYSIVGQLVVIESGVPVPNVELEVVTTSEHGKYSLGGASRSDANGEFRIQGALPGHYTVKPESDPALNTFGDPISFDVTDADVTGLKIPMHSAATLTGIVTIEGNIELPVADILSKLTVHADTLFDGLMVSDSSSPVTADGGFRIAGVRPGQVRLYPFAQRGGVSLLRIERNGAEVREGIEVRAGENVTGLRLAMGAGNGVLRGDVKIEGEPLEGVILSVLYRSTNSEPNRFSQAELDARRHFVIKGLLPGEYELMIGPMSVMISGDRGSATMDRMPTVKQTVVVGAGADAEVTLVMTLRPVTPHRPQP